jgi:uncharacterized protein
MQVNVAQLLKATIGSVKNYDVDETINIEGCDYTIRGTVDLMRTDHGILVEGKLKTDSELTCSRCLTTFDCPLTFNIEEVYLPSTDIVSGAPLPVPDDPGAFMIDERNILDLTEAIRQYALLAFPMKPLCRQDCAGLCPVCGVNLNKEHCDCAPEPADPRWSKLRELLKNDSNKPVKNLKGRK